MRSRDSKKKGLPFPDFFFIALPPTSRSRLGSRAVKEKKNSARIKKNLRSALGFFLKKKN
jgi:hypothetical protein